MKTLLQIQDEVFKNTVVEKSFVEILNEAAEIYAREMCEKQKKICADALQIPGDYEHGDFLGIYNNILDTPNATEQQ